MELSCLLPSLDTLSVMVAFVLDWNFLILLVCSEFKSDVLQVMHSSPIDMGSVLP